MKILVIAFSFVQFLYGILLESDSVRKQTKKCKDDYLILKIDSLNDYYIIYAKKDSSNYKIVSKKRKSYSAGDSIIKEKNNYFFNLTPLFRKDSIFGFAVSGSLNMHVSKTCVDFDYKTKICNEKGVYDILYKAENLEGLKISPLFIPLRVNK